MKKTYSTPLTGVYTVKAECLLGTSPSYDSFGSLPSRGGSVTPTLDGGDNDEGYDAGGAF